MNLNEIKDNEGSRKRRMRVGRGIGSGKGKTGGRGVKGQKSRTGVSINGFEGGQMPIFRRLPKRGFHNINRVEFETVNLSDLQHVIDTKGVDVTQLITVDILKSVGLVRGNKDGVKLLAKGRLSTKLMVAVDKASVSAVEAVQAVGGKVVLPEVKELV